MKQVPDQSEQSEAATGWQYGQICVAFTVAIVLQSLMLPCLCEVGTAKGKLALGVDALVFARTAIAWMRKETGRGWLFYAVLLYTSAFWIEGLAWVFTGH
jgi:hypothetical protein